MPTHPSSHPPTSRRIGLLSTYPPKICGLATFAAALEHGLVEAGHRVRIVRIDDGDTALPFGRQVVGSLVNGRPSSLRNAAALLSRNDVVIVQHEYGIYGGDDGDEVLELLAALDVPAIVVLHTVPLVPTPHQYEVLVEVAALASRVVVMTDTARERLLDGYPVDAAKVDTIPHGATTAGLDECTSIDRRWDQTPQFLTWGLLGPGKGIEHVIDALALLDDVRPQPRYTVAGVTHPKVLERRGEEYRTSLVDRAHAAGVGRFVTFDQHYRDVAALTRFVASSSVVVLPYDSRDQVTSGVLVDAIAAGRPVIATAFPHAVELLGSGAGIVVAHADPAAIADAIRFVLANPDALAEMAAEARRLAPSMSWSAVAERYVAIVDELVLPSQAVAM